MASCFIVMLIVIFSACFCDAGNPDDLMVYVEDTGSWYCLSVAGLTNDVVIWGDQWGFSGATPVAGDYDGDGTNDLAVYHEETGNWYISSVAGDVIAWSQQCGGYGHSPVQGDYDGDGVDDLALYNQEEGLWYIYSLDKGILAWDIHWGHSAAEPVPGDYDGDGVDDLAVYDTESCQWYVLSIASETNEVFIWAVQWGWEGAQVVPGDYDADGESDLAVYDSDVGAWYVLSCDEEVIMWEQVWGFAGTTAVSGDYTGDGRSDLAVYDHNTCSWFIFAFVWEYEYASAGGVGRFYAGNEVVNIYGGVTSVDYDLKESVVSWGTQWGVANSKIMTGNYGGGSYRSRSTTTTTTSSTTTTSITIPDTPLPDMVFVKGGSFTMGDTWGDGVTNELPTHVVTLSDYYIGKYEVTNEELIEFLQWAYMNGRMEENIAYGKFETGDFFSISENSEYIYTLNSSVDFTNKTFLVTDGEGDHACHHVSWKGALTFCNYLSEKANLAPFYDADDLTNCNWSANGYRLPTEAEWEYAARGGLEGSNTLYSGSDVIDDVAWYNTNSLHSSHEIGTKAPNELGLYDMSGNVWEWCWDSYGYYSGADAVNPVGVHSNRYTDDYRILRGGCSSDDAFYCRVVNRFNYSSLIEGPVGFRVVRPATD